MLDELSAIVWLLELYLSNIMVASGAAGRHQLVMVAALMLALFVDTCLA